MKSTKSRIPLSVTIISQNEEDRIKRAITSVIDWVDEVIVVDSGSTDNTVSIAKKLKAKVVFNAWKGYGEQKSFAESLCKNRWILNIDADEEVSPVLRAELIRLFQKNKLTCSGYVVTVKHQRRFSSKTPKFGPQDKVIRLYDKTHAAYSKHPIHDSVVITNGKVGILKGIVKHYCFKSYAHALAKINTYTTTQAETMYARGKCPSMMRIIMEPMWTFFKSYILNKYIFLGLEGFLESVIYSFNRTIRLAKTWELHKKHKKK